MKPRLLDFFCGAGGCSVGYWRAGFMPEGVDNDQSAIKRYPFMGWKADAMALLADVEYLDQFDAAHASPPCQFYSITRHSHSADHPDLLIPVYEAFSAWGERTGKPWVIENVPGASISGVAPIVICGARNRAYDPASGLTLRLRRHRLFWSNVPLLSEPCSCDSTPVGGVYGGGSSDRNHALNVRRGGYTPHVDVRRALMGTPWMTMKQTSQAIPPAYTEFIGHQLIDYLKAVAA